MNTKDRFQTYQEHRNQPCMSYEAASISAIYLNESLLGLGRHQCVGIDALALKLSTFEFSSFRRILCSDNWSLQKTSLGGSYDFGCWSVLQ